MSNITDKKYAQVVNPQENPNNPEQNTWNNIHNAVGNTTLYATSQFTKEKVSTKDKKTGKVTTSYKYNRPFKVTAHDFKLNIPSRARIDKINVAVRMKTSKDGTGSVFPAVGFYIKEGGKKVSSNVGKGETGWHNGVYWHYSEKRLSTTVHSASYSMSGEDFYKGGYTVANLNSSLCGVDLYFRGEYANQTVSLMYVYMTVEYTVPTYKIATDPTSTEDSPYELNSGVKKNVVFTIKQIENMGDVGQAMRLTIPWGTELVGNPIVKTSSALIDSHVEDTSDDRVKIWLVEFGTKGTATLTVPIIDYTLDTQMLRLRNITEPTPETPIPHKRFYYRTVRSKATGYEETTITHDSPVRKRHTTCFQVNTVAFSNDEYVEYTITNNHPYHFVEFSVNELTDDGVELLTDTLPERDYSANQGITVRFKVPSNKMVSISYNVCIRPFDMGQNTFNVASTDSTIVHHCNYDVLEPYIYHIGATENEDEENRELHLRFKGERINFTNHRIATNLETGAFILPCHVKDGDAVMVQSKPSIRMYKWEEIDYIGCVPLEHLHFDPKSTYKDKLLDSTYKNKRYMGKELSSDEDITLNVRVHPQQVTTLQGLVDMDKPIPINANHRCFEGDALNHRGWAEIYSIKAEETNPHWYKCDIDVKYLTHNLNTRFHITRGDKTFGTYPIPSLLAEIQHSGERISSLNNEDDFFIVDTDGTYAYIDDEFEWEDYLDYQGDPVEWIGGSWNNGVYTGTVMTVEDDNDNLITLRAVKSETETVNEILEYLEEQNEIVKPLEMNENIQVYEGYTIDDGLKNRFTLDEGQHISIKSRQVLSNSNQIEIRWGSSKLEENQENAISRITRLIDEDTGDIVFEYEYCDFDFSDFVTYYDQTTEELESLLRCRVIGRRKNGADYDTVIDDIIDLQSDVETSEDTYISDEDNTVHTDVKYFGSSLIFELSNNVLHLIDEGYNGKEIEADIQLEGKSYRWETYWENKNTGGENDDIIAYFDVIVQDSILISDYSQMYGSMYISPFPVTGKEIIFTRNAEEGVIYYLKEDNNEFSYLIEPYYQYHNGVDLRTSVDSESYISIFNLNYGYKVIYLENGLVSLGINRLNGEMYLRRWNDTIKEYITLFRFQLNKFEDVNINSISDDRIELQASDTTIIMYRGHPYVILRHPTEDIGITTKSYKVYGQSVDGETYTYPIYFDLMNKDNLLSECVTKKLDDDCVNITEHLIEDLDETEIHLNRVGSGDVYEGDTITLMVTDDNDNPFMSRVCYLVKKDDDTGFDEVGCNSEALYEYTMKKTGIYSFIAVYVGDETHTYSISEEFTIQVGNKEVYQKPPKSQDVPPVTGDYKLTMSCPSTMKYRDGSKVVFTLTKGGTPVKGKTIEMTDFNYTNTSMTDKNGQVSFSNNRAKNTVGTWQLGAKFWEGGNKPTKQVYKTVKVEKATPEFHVNHGAVTTKGKFSVNLRDADNHNIKLAKRNIVIKVNGDKKNRVTNENGSEAIGVTEKGTYKYICIFDGDKNYEKCKLTYREKVKQG